MGNSLDVITNFFGAGPRAGDHDVGRGTGCTGCIANATAVESQDVAIR